MMNSGQVWRRDRVVMRQKDMTREFAEAKMRWREMAEEVFKNATHAFWKVFFGADFGKTLVRLA